MFTNEIRAKYRVVRTGYGMGDFEETIPLGSWRKGGGLAGKKGHVYAYGPGWAGVWLNGRSARRKVDGFRSQFANLAVMQVGDGELTFRVPMGDLARLLPLLGAKRLFATSEAQKNALAKARKASPLDCAHEEKAIPGAG